MGVAPWHGRLLVLDRDDAGESTGHGARAAPGPRRARPDSGGGGLGGIRAVLHRMQVTSVSASPAMVTAVAGRWTAGAPTTSDATHPFRKHFEDLAVETTLHPDPDGDPGGHRPLRRPVRRPLLRPWTRPRPRPTPFFEAGSPGYFVVSAAAGLFVDPTQASAWPTTAWSGCASASPSTPATPWPWPDLPAEDGPGRRRPRRGPLGRRRDQPGRRAGGHLRGPHPGRDPGYNNRTFGR